MDSKTRQIYFKFWELLSETDIEQINESGVRHLSQVVDRMLPHTELYANASQRVKNALRFIEASELGSASYEIRCLLCDVRDSLKL